MEHGSLQNLLASKAKNPTVPEVGMGATQICWSDRHAYTVVEIKSAKTIVVQRDKAVRADKNGMSESQSYTFTPDPTAPRVTIRQRGNGPWKSPGGSTFQIGHRSEYHDFSF